jgi:hypothetical protein
MPYTLKLDWTYNRAETVTRYLAASRPTAQAAMDVWVPFQGGAPGDGYTLKLDWPPELITEVQARLATVLGGIARMIEQSRQGDRDVSPYEDLCADQAQVYAAIGDIADYRAAHDAAMVQVRAYEAAKRHES